MNLLIINDKKPGIMNITLISPYEHTESYGLRMISACLKKSGYKTKLIFMPKRLGELYGKYDLDRVFDSAKDSDLVGISLSTNFFERTVQITERLKKELNVPIIWGGIHPTVKPEECLEYADLVCIGEGEGAIVELAEKMEKGEDYSKVKNIGLKDKKGNIILNPLRPLIQDLDSLPFQDYDLKSQYIIFKGETYRMDEAFSKDFFGYLNPHGYPIFLTRGCPFSFTYCCNNYFNRFYSGHDPFRKRDVSLVIKELQEAKERTPSIKIIFFYDDNFFGLSENEIKYFSENYKKKINLPFVVVGTNPLAVTREKIASIAEAGLFFLKMGVQTGNERTKRLFKRTYPNSQVEKAAKIIAEFKDKIPLLTYEFIIDNPWENNNDIIENLQFLNKFPTMCHFDFFSLTFYPGTELYDMAKKEGIIKDEFKEIYQKNYFLPQNNYFNKLFFLIDLFSQNGKKIPSRIFSLLINKRFIRYKLNWPLYFFLYIFIKIWIEIDFKEKIYTHGIINRRGTLRSLIHLTILTLRTVNNKEWFKIRKYIRRRILKINTL